MLPIKIDFQVKMRNVSYFFAVFFEIYPKFNDFINFDDFIRLQPVSMEKNILS